MDRQDVQAEKRPFTLELSKRLYLSADEGKKACIIPIDKGGQKIPSRFAIDV